MAYKVVITPQAKQQLEMYVKYSLSELKNPQAAKAILTDAKQTKKKLSTVAGSLALCENKILAQYGYRKIMFSKHNFFMVYRIDNKIVSVDAMYHELQDYESAFTKQMKL